MARRKEKWQIYAEYYAARMALGAIGAFPLAWSMRIGEILSFVPFKLAKRLRFVGFRNLEMALPELSHAEHEKILRGTFASLGRQLGIFSHLLHLDGEKVRELVDVEGLESFQEAAKKDGGKFLFTGHFGGWEMSHIVASVYGFSMNVVARRLDNPLLEKLIERMRTALGSRTIDKEASGRTLFKLLKKGKFIGILVDLNTQEHEGIFVDFFGIPASTTNGLAKLALLTDASVIPAFAIWQKDRKRYLLKAYKSLEIPATGDTEEDIRILTQEMTAKIEEIIREYPDQWMWIHKRWNTRPPNEPPLYAKDTDIRQLKSPAAEQNLKTQNQIEANSQS